MKKTVDHTRGKPDVECIEEHYLPDKVLDWFKSKGSDVVGQPRRGESCPLHNYLADVCLPEEERVLRYFSVDTGHVTCSRWVDEEEGRTSQVFPQPKWASEFVRRLDGRFEGSEVNGNDAATLLQGVCEEFSV